MNETDLILEAMGKEITFPPFSARNCIQSLNPIPQGILRRTINGKLVVIGNKGHRKFESTITCKDKNPPSFEGFWIGSKLKVGCLQALTQSIPKNTPRIELERDPLFVTLYETSGKICPFKKGEGKWIEFPPQFLGGFITYRPSLLMIVKNYHLETDEWGLTVGWKLELEEE